MAIPEQSIRHTMSGSVHRHPAEFSTAIWLCSAELAAEVF
jgi:hypothetical protein